jgi:hypothetical membrane protein
VVGFAVVYSAFAGVIAPILFVALVVVQGLLQPDYGHVAMPISALATWPAGWIQNLNFFVFGGLMTAHAVGLHLGIRPGRGGLLGPALLAVSGIGSVFAGIFPMARGVDGALIEPVGHAVASFMVFLGAGIGLMLMSRRMAGDPAWRGVANVALACGVAVVLLFPIMGVLAVPDDGLLHPWFGLLQRVVLVVWFPCILVLAIRLLRLARVSKQSTSATA